MEWKVGYRFTLEYLITKVVEDYVIAEIGDAENILSAEEMALAKLIQPAAPEPAAKLDVTKPVRRIWSDNTGRIVGRTLDGKKLIFEHDLGGMCLGPESDFENIPEPKRTTTQIVELVNFDFGPRIMMKSDGAFYVNVSSRAKVSYTEGEGWSIEEVEDEK